MFSQDRRQEGRGCWAAGFGPCKGCHVGGGRPQFHKVNTATSCMRCPLQGSVCCEKPCRLPLLWHLL